MKKIKHNRFLKDIGLYLLFAIFYTFSYAQCTLKNAESSSKGYLKSSGNVKIDNVVMSEKIKLEQFFNVKVDLKFSSGSNGFARPYCKNLNCNGTIELGKNLLNFEYNKKGVVTKEAIGKYMIISIMAHEFAHIFQYTHPEFVFKNTVIQEVHADMLAGYYMSKYFINNSTSDYRYDYEASKKISNRMSDMGISFGWLGDIQYWSQQHHGNYYTRSVAFQEPWRCLDGRPTKYSCYNFTDFLETSLEYAEYLVNTFDKD